MERKFPLRYDENAQQEMYDFFEEKDNLEVEERAEEYEWQRRQESVSEFEDTRTS